MEKYCFIFITFYLSFLEIRIKTYVIDYTMVYMIFSKQSNTL